MKHSPPAPSKDVSIYIDGFNLYHRCLEHQPKVKWLCFKTLFSKFILQDPIVRIKYFTAKIDPYAKDETPGQRRQKAYWDALEGAGVEIILGRLESRKRNCKSECQGTYYTMSEKMSDVSMALHIYRDFQKGLVPRIDKATGKEIPGEFSNRGIVYVLSADLDVVPALRMIREIDPKCDIRVMLPTTDENLYWSRSEDFSFVRLFKLNQEWLEKSQFPSPAKSKMGANVLRPSNWC